MRQCAVQSAISTRAVRRLYQLERNRLEEMASIVGKSERHWLLASRDSRLPFARCSRAPVVRPSILSHPIPSHPLLEALLLFCDSKRLVVALKVLQHFAFTELIVSTVRHSFGGGNQTADVLLKQSLRPTSQCLKQVKRETSSLTKNVSFHPFSQ